MSHRARSLRSAAAGRALLVVAALALAGAAVLVWSAWRTTTAPEAVLTAPSASAVTTPPTIPPLATLEPTTTAAPVAPGAVDPGTQPTSPLAAQLGQRGSALLDREPPPRVEPATLTIDDLELWAPVRPVGLQTDGQMEIPDETEIGWYELGASPGETGATVLAAHVTWNDTVGPFYRLARLEPGAEVRMRLSDGSTRTYEVVERTMFPKDGLPNWRIFRRTGPESLVLITCGGSFNPSIRRYRDNIVVFAVPVGQEPAAADDSTEPAP